MHTYKTRIIVAAIKRIMTSTQTTETIMAAISPVTIPLALVAIVGCSKGATLTLLKPALP